MRVDDIARHADDVERFRETNPSDRHIDDDDPVHAGGDEPFGDAVGIESFRVAPRPCSIRRDAAVSRAAAIGQIGPVLHAGLVQHPRICVL